MLRTVITEPWRQLGWYVMAIAPTAPTVTFISPDYDQYRRHVKRWLGRSRYTWSEQEMQNTKSALNLPAAITIGALLAIAVALVSQYGFNLQPCAWCVLQRLLFLAIAIVGAMGLPRRMIRYRVVVGGLVLILALLGDCRRSMAAFRGRQIKCLRPDPGIQDCRHGSAFGPASAKRLRSARHLR